MRRHWDRIAVGALIALIAIALIVGQSVTRTVHGRGTVAQAVTIPGSDGTDLSAFVIPAKGSESGDRVPLLVMPASWASTSREYLKAGEKLAAQGYEVISYAQRGFRPSLGLIDFGDTKTQADVSAVIDWAVAHTDADKNRIGAIGISYGAGVSLLAAERDPRIKAVVAMTGWADLGASLDPNHTLNKVAVSGLMQSGLSAGNLDAELNHVRTNLQLGLTTPAETMVNAPVRSPQTGVAAMNKNKTAVMIANGYEDSLILPNQLVTFFNDLTGPKRLELRVGDHGGPENSGLQGAQNDVWANATKWLDHFVRGAANGIQDQQPIQLKDAVTNQWHAIKDASALTTGTKLTLGAASGSPETGALQPDAAASAWSRRIVTGTDTSANSGSVQINNPRFVIPSGVSIAAVNRTAGLVWAGPAVTTPQVIAGEPHLHVTVTPSGAAATLFAYLYDVDPVSGGSLVTYAPYSLVGVTPGQPQTVDLDLATIAWTVPAGHHLALVIDTADARYANRNPVGSALTFSSSAADPATFSIPSA